MESEQKNNAIIFSFYQLFWIYLLFLMRMHLLHFLCRSSTHFYLNLFHNFLLRSVGNIEAHFQLQIHAISLISKLSFQIFLDITVNNHAVACWNLEFSSNAAVMLTVCFYIEAWVWFRSNGFRIHHWNAIKIRGEINEKRSSWFLIEQNMLKCERINDAFPYGFHME